MLGANFIDYDLTFQRAGSYEPSGEDPAEAYEGIPYPEVSDQSKPSIGIGGFQAIPLIAISTDLGHPEWPVRFGAGIFVPQGYSAREFAEEIDVGVADPAPGPQRYDIIKQNIVAAQPSLVVAWSPLDNLDVGARVAWGFATIEGRKATWSFRNYEEWVGQDTVFNLEASDKFVPAFSLGALYRVGDSIELGAAYNSAMNIHAKGVGYGEISSGGLQNTETVPVPDEYAVCAPGGEPGALKTCMDATVAQNATLGARYIVRQGGVERADIELDVRWEDWSASAVTRIQTDSQVEPGGIYLKETLTNRGFQDVLSVRLGGSYSIPVGAGLLTVRAGAAHDTAAAPDSWTRVDMDGKARTTLAGGLAYTTGRYRFDLGGGAVLEPDVTAPSDCNPTAQNQGCDGSGTDTPVAQRNQPDPIQALSSPNAQIQSPFNGGTYESGYLLFSFGVTAAF
jgi:long-subunit fatty acid transport protein